MPSAKDMARGESYALRVKYWKTTPEKTVRAIYRGPAPVPMDKTRGFWHYFDIGTLKRQQHSLKMVVGTWAEYTQTPEYKKLYIKELEAQHAVAVINAKMKYIEFLAREAMAVRTPFLNATRFDETQFAIPLKSLVPLLKAAGRTVPDLVLPVNPLQNPEL